MNLAAFFKRGAAHAPSEAERAAARITKAAEETRKKWLNALLVDQTRAWMSVGGHDDEVIEGMAAMLTIAGFAHVYDCHDIENSDVRIIRGAVSAATNAINAGGLVSVDDARAFSAAATRAKAIIETCSVEAIIHAAQTIRETVGLPSCAGL